MQVALNREDWFTYEETAKELGRSHSTVARAASQGILHPKSLPGTRIKYIHRDEIEWFRDKTLTEANAILYQDMKKREALVLQMFLIPETFQNNPKALAGFLTLWFMVGSILQRGDIKAAEELVHIVLTMNSIEQKDEPVQIITDEQKKVLKELWETGLDFGQIISEMGTMLVTLIRNPELPSSVRQFLSKLLPILTIPEGMSKFAS